MMQDLLLQRIEELSKENDFLKVQLENDRWRDPKEERPMMNQMCRLWLYSETDYDTKPHYFVEETSLRCETLSDDPWGIKKRWGSKYKVLFWRPASICPKELKL